MAQDKLAESMFLMLHDVFTGRPQVGLELLMCSLVAAELAELMLNGRVGMDDELIIILEPDDPDADEVSAFVVDSIQSQPRAYGVRSWVEVLGEVLYEMVADRVIQSGIVSRERGSRRLLKRTPDRFPSIDLVRASTSRVRMQHMLRVPDDFDLPGAVLAAILGALDVVQSLDVGIDRAGLKATIAELTQQLSPDLRGLVAGVEASVAAISLTVRR